MCKKLFYAMQIKCKICDNIINTKGLTLHLKSHSINFFDYVLNNLNDFPQYKLCEICGKPTKWKHACSLECISKWKQLHWRGENHIWFGKRHSNKTKKLISKKQKERLTDITKTVMYGKKHSNKTKKLISQTRKRLKLGIGNKNGMFGKTHTPEAIEKIFKHKKMNKLEKKVASWLDYKNLKYTFQFFINDNGICKSYDFKLKNYNIIIEVYGDYWHGGSGVKKHVFNVDENIKNDEIKLNIAKRNGYTVIQLWEHDINNDISIIENELNRYL